MADQLYPAWRYHPTEPARIVENEAEDEALGEGWVETPAKFPKAKAEKPEKAEVEKPEAKKPEADDDEPEDHPRRARRSK